MSRWLSSMLLLGGVGLLFAWALTPVWLALLISVLFYLLLDPVAGRLQARGVRRESAILYALLPPLLLMIYGTFYVIESLRLYLPDLAADVEHLQQAAALALFDFETRLEQLIGLRLRLAEQTRVLDLNAMLQTDRLIQSGGVFANLLVNIALVPPLAFFLLRDYRRWRDTALSMLPNDQFELGWLMYFGVSTRMQAYLRALVWQAIILATITTAGFWIAGFPSPLLLGVLTGIAGLVPYLGPFLAMVPPLVMLLSAPVFQPEGILEIFAVIAVGFGFDNLVTVPFLLAGTVNLHPGVAMLAVVIAGHVGGIPAMILVIPLLGMLKIIVQSLLRGLGPALPAAAGD